MNQDTTQHARPGPPAPGWPARLLDRAASLAALASGALLMGMMLLGALDAALGQAGFHVPGAFEATELLLAAAALLPLAHATRTGGMIRVGFVRRRLPRTARRAADVLAALLALGLYTLLAWQAWLLTAASARVDEYAAGAVAFPVAPAKAALALALTLAALAALAQIPRAARGGEDA